jgi:pimeloyl-ACP methyl ester carboxylesterase
MPVARTERGEIGYDETGSGEPLLLITGLGCQRVLWPDGLVAAFAERGFRVIRYDHRDVGESLRTPGPPPPHRPWLIARALVGRPTASPYDLAALAADAAALLDHLEIPAAHVLGASMGGMIAQTFALQYPARVRTLTSMMSSPGGRRFLPLDPRLLPGVIPRVPAGRDAVIAWHLRLFRTIGSTGFPFDEAEHRDIAARGFDRGHNPHAFTRHLAAVLAPRRPLSQIRVPTLVLHGEADRLVPLRAARATAREIPGAKLVTFRGMGHDLPRALWPRFADEVSTFATGNPPVSQPVAPPPAAARRT